MNDTNNSGHKWDILLITANGHDQAQVLEAQISGIYSKIIPYFKRYIIQRDPIEDYGELLQLYLYLKYE